MERRSLLQAGLGAAAALLGGCKTSAGPDGARERSSAMESAMKGQTAAGAGTMPAVFLAHGSPLLLDDAAWMGELAAWARALPRPKSILVVSAHWLDAPVTLGASRTIPLVYDFYGFPQKYYDVKYAAPGAPELKKRVRELLTPTQPVDDDETRGLDHGAYIPLVPMYPQADVPVLQMSIPTMEPAKLVALGKALAPLRDEGVLIMGSGFLTHNMRAISWDGSAPPPSWANEFDAFCAETLAKRDVDALVHYRERAPGVQSALPTHEHFVPVMLALGASLDRTEAATFPIAGFTYGSFTKRSVQFG
jgi:4,5-DOPA dioxygenase extradiol